MTEGVNGTKSFIDRQRISQTSYARKAWVLRVNNAEATKRDGWTHAFILTEYRCLARSYRELSYTSYSADENIYEDNQQSQLQYEAATPESIGEQELDFVCGFKVPRGDPIEIGNASADQIVKEFGPGKTDVASTP